MNELAQAFEKLSNQPQPSQEELKAMPLLWRKCSDCDGLFSRNEEHSKCKRCRSSNQDYESTDRRKSRKASWLRLKRAKVRRAKASVARIAGHLEPLSLRA